MAGSTRTLQQVVDYVATMGDVAAQLPVGGFSTANALSIANDVATDMLAQMFNWKFNRVEIPPFVTNSWQQDYAQVGLSNVGWLERAAWIDINNTVIPKPIGQLETVRDLPRTSFQYGWPVKISWDYNENLVQGQWPGPNTLYVNPLGATATPANPPINILDASGNIIVLTTYGTTGAVPPDWGVPNAPSGSEITDGTCVWTVAAALEQGFRIVDLPPQTGVVYQIFVTAQMRPVRFTQLKQTLAPIPDDYAKFFEDGIIAYAHRMSPNPGVKAQFEARKKDWLMAMQQSKVAGDREREDACFIPERGMLSGTGPVTDLGAGAPFGNSWFRRGYGGY